LLADSGAEGRSSRREVAKSCGMDALVRRFLTLGLLLIPRLLTIQPRQAINGKNKVESGGGIHPTQIAMLLFFFFFVESIHV
jgi:hypothetical protein